MLEDDFTYVLRKALTGHGLTLGEAAARVGIPDADLERFLGGRFCEKTARKLARLLDLNEQAYAAHPLYQPVVLDSSHIVRLDLPFGEETVNAWLVRDAGVCILFDAGFRAADLIDQLALHGASSPDLVLITHGHRDHVGALRELRDAGLEIHSPGMAGTATMSPGEEIQCGPLSIRACDLSGHFAPSLGYQVDGLSRPLLVVGDALFAGSIGGCATPSIYQHALDRLRDVLAPLPDSTVLLPGHGPATTLGEERGSNPFL